MSNTIKQMQTVWGIDEGVHSSQDIKPMLTPEEQVLRLKAKGITFKRCNEANAIEVLSNRNTYLHLTAFRKMFQKYEDGEHAGQYVALDFSDLLYLDNLDSQLRRTFQLITGDIERIAKTHLLTIISTNPAEDGYGIIADFMYSLPPSRLNQIRNDLRYRAGSSKRSDVYLGSLIGHYRAAMPVWVFLEVVTFGTILAFMLFCATRWNDEQLKSLHYVLTDVKAVRNCCSHGSCLINGFTSAQVTPYSTSTIVYNWLADHKIKNTKARRNKLSNRRMQQLITTLVVFDFFCTDGCDVSRASLETLEISLEECVGRFGVQNSFVSYISFLVSVIDRIH